MQWSGIWCNASHNIHFIVCWLQSFNLHSGLSLIIHTETHRQTQTHTHTYTRARAHTHTHTHHTPPPTHTTPHTPTPHTHTNHAHTLHTRARARAHRLIIIFTVSPQSANRAVHDSIFVVVVLTDFCFVTACSYRWSFFMVCCLTSRHENHEHANVLLNHDR